MLDEILQNRSLIEACIQYKVKKLHVFGSVVSGDNEVSGDIDFGVDFEREGFSGAFEQFMGFKDSLEEILEKPVDLIVSKPFRNTVFQEEVNKTKRLVYAA